MCKQTKRFFDFSPVVNHFFLILFLILACNIAPSSVIAAEKKNTISNQKHVPKYVFLFIGDGMSFPQIMALGNYNGTVNKNFVGTRSKPTPENLPEAEMPSFVNFPINAAVTTPDASKFVTDSASAATALATGSKTLDGMVGLDPANKRLENLSEMFKKQKGYKIGIISSMSLEHATPAAFYAHNPSRQNYYDISINLIESDFDFFGGGGIQYPTGKNKDKADFFELAKKAGYTVVNDKDSIMALSKSTGKTIAINPDLDQWGAMNYAIDQRGTDELRLKDFVKKGIDVIDNDKGFFMMVEGGKIDWASHGNDAFTAILDVKELDEAVKVATEFAKKHPDETLIVVVGDHETGGLTVGFGGLNYDSFMARLSNQTMSYQFFTDKYVGKYRDNQTPFEVAMNDVKAVYGLLLPEDPDISTAKDPGMVLSTREVKRLKEAYALSLIHRKQRDTKSYDYSSEYSTSGYEPFTMALTQTLNNKAGLGWTTGAHTALPVSLHAIGAKSDIFAGFYDNTDVCKKIKQAAGLK